MLTKWSQKRLHFVSASGKLGIEQPNSVISIHFIGGEPLLEQEVILEIVDEIQNINANVNIRYYIDTNLSYIPSLPLPQAYRNKNFLILQGFPCFFYVSLI